MKEEWFSKAKAEYCYQRRKVKYCTGKATYAPTLLSSSLTCWDYLLIWHFVAITSCAVISYHNISLSRKNKLFFYIYVSTYVLYYYLYCAIPKELWCVCLSQRQLPPEKNFHPTVYCFLLCLFLQLPSYSFPDAYPRCISLVLFLAKTW